MSKVFIGYTTRGGDYVHTVIEGEETPHVVLSVCGVVVHKRSESFKLDSPWACKRCVKILSKRSRTHESELPNIKLKCDKCGRPHWNVKQANGQPPQYNGTDIAHFVTLGYRRTSRKYGIISRVDRPDWKEFLARKGMLIGPEREGNGADHYRACYSKDKITLEPPSLALDVPTSGHDPVGFIPKDQLEQKLADAYAAECAECGRMRTTIEVLPVKPRPGDGDVRYVLLVNGVAVLEFENGTAQAGKVYKALRTEPRP